MATPTDRRDYAAFLRGPVATNTFAYGTVDDVRSGVQHHGLMGVFPEPADGNDDDFGIIAPGGFTVEIADEGDDDWFLLAEDGSYILREDQTRIILEY